MSNRKIWSMPIAAFALAVMLASALIATGIVQAQAITVIDLTTALDYDVDGDGTDDAIGFIIEMDDTDVGDGTDDVTFDPDQDLDVDGNDAALNFELSGNDSTPFLVTPTGTGDADGTVADITVRPGATLSAKTYVFTLKATHLATPTIFNEVQIAVTVVPIPIITAFKDGTVTEYTVDEHQTGYTGVKDVEDFGDDVVADPSKVLTFSVMGLTIASDGTRTLAASSQFEFDGSKLTTTAGATGLDYEDASGVPSFLLEITVTDVTVSDTLDINVTLTDVDPEVSPPVAPPDNEFTVLENIQPGDDVGTVVGYTTAGAAIVTSSVSRITQVPQLDGASAVGDVFDVSATGVITLATGKVLDADNARLDFYVVTLDVSDSNTPANTATVVAQITVEDVDEPPVFDNQPGDPEIAIAFEVAENVRKSESVPDVDNTPNVLDDPENTVFAAITAVDPEDSTVKYRLVGLDGEGAPTTVTYTGPFGINEDAGQLIVADDLDYEVPAADRLHMFAVEASDESSNVNTRLVTIEVTSANEPPYWTNVDDATGMGTVVDTIEENPQAGKVVYDYDADDPDGDIVTLRYTLREATGTQFFSIDEDTGVVTVAAGAQLDYERQAVYNMEIAVDDGFAEVTAKLEVTLVDIDDNNPTLVGPTLIPVSENHRPNLPILGAVFVAADADLINEDTLTLTLQDDLGKYAISDDGVLSTTTWLDADEDNSDVLVLVASDGSGGPTTLNVTITIGNEDDSISNVRVKKANPVPGTEGDPGDALDDNPANYVSAGWANWGTTLRIEVKRQSPDPECNANCVFIDLEADSSGATRTLEARRTLTQNAGNVFVAAVTLVEDYGDAQDNDMDAGVTAYLKVDEEDEIDIRFGNARGSVDVENEAPEITNFAPEHEAAFDDGDVDYTFTVTDAVSGIPEPEDLPDGDGDGDYTAVAALVSEEQCDNVTGIGNADLTLPDGKQIKCNDSTLTVRPIVDDKDFDSIDDGFDVETTIVLTEGEVHYVTFIACDAAGNCAVYDPDENTADEALPEITVDDEAPEFDEARAGVTWNATDNEYDDNRAFIQLIFNDLTALNPATVEVDDFVVEGHTIKAVHMFDPDSKDTLWGDVDENGNLDMSTTPTRFGRDAKYQQIDRSVFVELEDELAPDETPDVAVVPNGVEDQAGHDQDDGEHEADDWIAPDFTVVSIVSPRVTGQSEVLAGEDDQVVFTVTSDERLDASRPSVEVTYVNAPDGCVETKDSDDYDRGEIKTGGSCGGSATGTGLNPTIEKVSNTEWVITIDKPKATGYYNFFISGFDRSSANRNEGSEGVSADNIETDFFKKNGDVNTDDAYFFEADLNLSNPEVKISGEMAGDVEPTVEFRSPLFIGIDFTRTHSAPQDCDAPMSDRENCLAESDEYAEDNYDSVTITSFMLDGVDLTDSVKTTDDETFLLALDNIGVGEHELSIQAMDAAGNTLDDALEIEFEIEERGPFEKRLSPGWNLVSLPGEPADSSIDAVFGSGVEVRTVYTYDPVVPGGWMVAVRETVDGDWQGDLMEITGQRGYWVLSDAIQDWEVSIPRLAGGSGGTGTPIQPPSIPLYAGWNLIPVTDVTGEFDDDIPITVGEYLNSLDDGLDLARVLGFDTIRNDWSTLTNGDNVEFGKGYWVFVREAGTLVPGK